MKNICVKFLMIVLIVFVLVGCAGEQGIQGPQGEPGIQGPQGEPGKEGHSSVITIGENGNWYVDGVDTGVSAKGESGLSAYETFLKYYPDYTGTEKEWITDVAMGNKCNLFGHEWDEGVTTTEPTNGNEGEKTYSCLNCNEHKYEVLPKIEVANFEIYEIDGIKYVNYGSYPQTHVGDADLIAELNKLTETNSRGYYEYDGQEYAKVNTKPYNSGTQAYTYSDGSIINRNVTEWFKVEPIKWRIISENADGSYQLYSEYILDATKYYNDIKDHRNINGVEIYENNYKYSNIRAWLNGYNGTEYKVSDYTNIGFYNIAFKDNEKGTIITKEVDNSASTTGKSTNNFACENTFDKIYLLSYKDMFNSSYGFNEYETRYAQVTDYAKALGVRLSTSEEYLDNGYYWLRSPSYIDCHHADCVFSDVSHSSSLVSDSSVYNDYYGVRAACTINLE